MSKLEDFLESGIGELQRLIDQGIKAEDLLGEIIATLRLPPNYKSFDSSFRGVIDKWKACYFRIFPE